MISPILPQNNIDAFGRLRVGEPFTITDYKLIHDKAPLFWDETVPANTTSTYNTNQSSVTLAVTGAGTVIRQTKQRFNYQPGKSMLIYLTGVLGSTPPANVTKYLGYFDNSNGIFIQQNSTGLSWGIRSFTTGSAVDRLVAQADWNIDSLDGTGDSGITLDPTKTQIFVIDFEWLGVGTVRCGFAIDDKVYYAHYFHNANAALTTVYMTTPNLPIRYEIVATGANTGASLVQICSTVISEGGQENTGLVRYIGRGVTGYVTGNNSNLHALLSLRLKSTHLDISVIPQSISILNTSNVDYEWLLLLNPTVAGTDAASWVSLTNSAIEYDVSRTTTNTLSGGTILAGGYNSSVQEVVNPQLVSNLRLGATLAGVRDELVLAVRNVGGTSETYYAGLSWRELL